MSSTAWAADSVERWPVSRLAPYASNARTHSEEQIRQLAASIEEWGWTVPVLVGEDGVIIAGHGRVQAAQRLGLAEVPVMVARGWSEAQRRAYVLADNKLASNAGWNDALLKSELADLVGLGIDLGSIGFSADEAATLLPAGNDGLTDPDAAPAADPVTVSRVGDLWLLGAHRLLCGGATLPEAVNRLFGDAKPNLMVTDPPYGVSYDASWRNRVVRSDGSAVVARAVGAVTNDDQDDWRRAWGLFPGAVAYVWHAGTRVEGVAASLRAAGFHIRAQIVWVKQRHVLSRGDYHAQHEPCFYGVRDPEEENWNFVPEHEVAAYAVRKGEQGAYRGGRKQSTVWFIEHQKSETGHSTQKPIEAMRRPIENNSGPGDHVYDPFVGSGTTIIAAEMLGRAALALEIAPAYVDVCVRRWEGFAGRQAILEGAGRTFAQVAAERAAERC